MASGIERRQFLKVIGASGAGASMAACGGTDAAERLIPYVVPNEEIVPGLATWYRTTCRECPSGCGMNIRTREGRAVKAEGNPLSPISHGKLCAGGQASLHGLYNPDRIRRPLARTSPNGADEADWDALNWDAAEQRLAEALDANRGRTVFLTHAMTGSMDALIDAFCAAYGIQRVRYEPFAHEALRAGYAAVGGTGVPVHDFSAAEVVVTFGADFLETWLSPVDYAHGYTRGHAYDGGRRGRMIHVGPHQSLTGMNADEWLACRPGTEHLVALALAQIVGGAGGVDPAQVATAADVPLERLQQVAAAFGNGGRSLAVGPGVASSHAAAVEVARGVALLNQAAGNIGSTVHLDRAEHPATAGSYAQMTQLVAQMRTGAVGALLVHGPNPVYSLPDRAAVDEALANVAFTASFSPYLDETSARAHLLLPDHHFLESWDDVVPRTGITGLVQPVMTPVFETKQTGDVLLSVARRGGATLPTQATTYYDYLRERLGATLGGDAAWREALQVGFVLSGGAQGAGEGGGVVQGGGGAGGGAAGAVMMPPAGAQQDTSAVAGGAILPVQPQQPAAGQTQLAPATFAGNDGDPYLIVYPSYKFYDGRMANRPWLQELGDPVNKLTWSSCVEIHPDYADELGIDDGHIVEVTTAAGTFELPAWRHPAMRRDTIAIQLGQGHEAFGTYAKDRGFNPIRLLADLADPASGGFVWQQTRAAIRNTGRWERPPTIAIEKEQHGRGIAEAITLNDAVEADRARGLIPAGFAVATTAPAPAQPAAGTEAAHQVDPMTAQVEQLQGAGGFAPETIDASPRGFPPPGTHYGEYTEAVPRWGMAIDLEKCFGCGACTTACYAENNIGMVGPKLVAQGRILHWIRIERYFEGEGTDVQTRFLPMLCQHCSNAPCEPVCPVYAAYHTPDGLNGQVYNRCVGTRYCANNCPYKVRVFNYFSYEWPEPLNWQLNPDVTVREKGVMEKCTFCVQRIRDAENEARLDGRGVHDGEITPACAATCPGDAIVFGNMRDPDSRVSRVAASGRGYRVFEHLNTQSAIVYLKKVATGAEV
jgi:anaerobic selenocysteine-containing dehydrogenase/Fe-S-cluster-containing dehydrogenase component